jgi:methylenetetrahydrofolate reductase (NADPH)
VKAPVVRRHRAALRHLLSHVRYEVLPTARTEDEVVTHLPRGSTVTITASPAKGLSATLDLTERLAAHGYDAVPHLAARMVSGPAELADIVDRLREAGVSTIFVPAGDADPAGPYPGAVDLLRALGSIGHPFARIGVTGYPESHPTIHDDVTIQAMWDKRAHADHVVSNLTFDPEVLGGWVRRVRERGVATPVLVGLPGPVERTKLLAMAARIGVGESTRFLAKNTRLFARIAAPGGYDPMRLLARAAPVIGDDAMGVAGLHLFTFNQVAETETWRRRQLERLGDEPVTTRADPH